MFSNTQELSELDEMR